MQAACAVSIQTDLADHLPLDLGRGLEVVFEAVPLFFVVVLLFDPAFEPALPADLDVLPLREAGLAVAPPARLEPRGFVPALEAAVATAGLPAGAAVTGIAGFIFSARGKSARKRRS